ncbi:hypothetical protein B0A80_16935 [Flavobacterium tructae]|nr:hypothetical protein B0A80_16935 [Flavobacterium tructae]
MFHQAKYNDVWKKNTNALKISQKNATLHTFRINGQIVIFISPKIKNQQSRVYFKNQVKTPDSIKNISINIDTKFQQYQS